MRHRDIWFQLVAGVAHIISRSCFNFDARVFLCMPLSLHTLHVVYFDHLKIRMPVFLPIDTLNIINQSRNCYSLYYYEFFVFIAFVTIIIYVINFSYVILFIVTIICMHSFISVVGDKLTLMKGWEMCLQPWTRIEMDMSIIRSFATFFILLIQMVIRNWSIVM